jgi:hypothetical protein
MTSTDQQLAALADKRVRDAAQQLLAALIGCVEHIEHSTPQGLAAHDAARVAILCATGEPVNSEGSYYAPDGTLMNADGTRSIFDDIDK